MNKGWLSGDNGRSLRNQTQSQISNIYTRLQEAPATSPHRTPQKRLMQEWDKLDYLRQTLQKLYKMGQMASEHYKLALAQLEADIIEIEYKAGMREWPAPQPPPVVEQATPSPTAVVTLAPDEIPQQPPRPPRPPWTWERFWDSLLSERTLKAILFLGALLLFASAISWVASNWSKFTPLVQGTFLVSATAVFYSLGWFVRVKQGLRESGIAITGVASFLVPLDFLVYYLSGGFPSQSWPTVWLAASLVCLGLYLLMTISLQAEFFGYLVALAATSLTVSFMNWLHIPFDWWQAGAAGSALALALASDLCRRAKTDWHIFAAPLGRMALVTAVPVMLIGAGWGYAIQQRSPAFYMALAISWWLGGGSTPAVDHTPSFGTLKLNQPLRGPLVHR